MTEETGSLRSTRVSLTSSGRKGNRQQQHRQAVQQAGHAQVLLKSPAINRLYQLDLQSCRLLLNLKRQSLHLHYLLLPGSSSVSRFETLFQSPTPVGIVLGELTEPVTAIKVGMSDVGQHFAHRCHFSPKFWVNIMPRIPQLVFTNEIILTLSWNSLFPSINRPAQLF